MGCNASKQPPDHYQGSSAHFMDATATHSQDKSDSKRTSIDTAAIEEQSHLNGEQSLLALAMNAKLEKEDKKVPGAVRNAAASRKRRETELRDDFSPRETEIEVAGASSASIPTSTSAANPTKIRIPESHSSAITADEHKHSNDLPDLKYSMRSNAEPHLEKAVDVGNAVAPTQPFSSSGVRKLQPIANAPSSHEQQQASCFQQHLQQMSPGAVSSDRFYAQHAGVGRGISGGGGGAGLMPRGPGVGRGFAGPMSPLFRGQVQAPAMVMNGGAIGRGSVIITGPRGMPRPLHVMPARSGGSQRGQVAFQVTPHALQPSAARPNGFASPEEKAPLVDNHSHESVENDNDDDDDDLVADDDEVGEWDLGDERDAAEDKPFHDKDALPNTVLVHSTPPPLDSISLFKKLPPKPIQTAKSPDPSPSKTPAKFRPMFVNANDLDVVNVDNEDDSSDDDDSNYDGDNDGAVGDWFDDDSAIAKSAPPATVSSPPRGKKLPSREQAESSGVGTKSVPGSPSAHTVLPPSTFRHPTSSSENMKQSSPHPPPMQRLPSHQFVAGGGNLSPTKPVGSPMGGSPLKQVSYRSNIMSTGQPVLVPMAMGTLTNKDASAVASSNAPIRDTKVVKKKRAELPQRNLPHPTPKFGDWLNSRTMINNYIILEPLGSGSYAEVKLCKEKVSGKLYAMKFINRDIMKKDKLGKQSKLDDIKREIAIMKKLNHPNVLRLYEVMDDPTMNKLFLVLEYMKHGDLLSHQKKKHASGMMENLHDRDLHCVCLQVVLGLAYLHEQKIVHGDIKPQNILVGDQDAVKIADFGISQSLYGSKQKLSDSAGTPAFMSPEMCSGEEYSGQLADIWAVGATIFMLKFGNPPFLAKSAMQMFEKIQNDPLVFPFPIDPLLQDLLTGMMVKDPQQRMTLEDVMSHPWVTKEEHSSTYFSNRQAAPQITVSNDEIEHAIASKDQFAIIVNIRIQMMKKLQKARQEMLGKIRLHDTERAHKRTTNGGGGGSGLVENPSKLPVGTPKEESVHDKSLKTKASKHKQNKIHADHSSSRHDDGHEMLSCEEISYRAQLFSRKKTGSTAPAGGGKAKDQGTHGFEDNDGKDSKCRDTEQEEDDDDELLSSDDDDMAVAQSPQLLDELLLTTLSMPPLSKTKPPVEDHHCQVQVSNPPQVTLPPGESASAQMTIHPPTEGNDMEGFFGQSTAMNLQFGVSSLQGRRSTQEDRWVVAPVIEDVVAPNWTKSAFVGLYDGHGGEECSNILHEQLHAWIFRDPHDLKLSPQHLQSCFEELDSYVCDYLLQKGDLSGSTATCVILSPSSADTGKIHAIVAHVGDCRLVLSLRNHKVVEVTNDHRLALAEERDRILRLGGRVVNNRVNGVMAITRAFGDLEFKGLLSKRDANDSSMSIIPTTVQQNPFQKEEEKVPTLLTARPDIHTLELDPKVHEFLLLACDGLWDVMTSEEAAEIFRDRLHFHGNLQVATKELAQEAIRRYSNDNITVLAIQLAAPPH